VWIPGGGPPIFSLTRFHFLAIITKKALYDQYAIDALYDLAQREIAIIESVMALEVDRASPVPLYVQVRDALGALIDRGDLAPGQQMPPMRQLAEAYGVTLGTVGQAIEMLQREGRAVAHVGRGVFVKKGVRQARRHCIYLCIHPHFLSNAGGSRFQRLQGIMHAADARSLRLHPITDPEALDVDEVRRLRAGVIFFDANYVADGFGEISHMAVRHEIPCCVAVGVPGLHPQVMDHRDICFELATEHLLKLGHERIAFVNHAGSTHGDAKQNKLGYVRALRRYGVYPNEDYYVEAPAPEESSDEPTCEAVERLLSLAAMPTAIVCNNDTRALLVIDLLRERGMRAPDDVSVTGCDNLPECERSLPRLTSVDWGYDERGAAIIEYIVGRLEGGDPPLPEAHPRLVVRESSSPLRKEACAESGQS